MICWSCRRDIPATAKFCPHCEAEVEEEPTADEQAAVQDVLADMGPDVIDELRDAFAKSTTGEEFVNRVMIGDCPQCGSSNTQDCEKDPEIDDLSVARCLACGQLWCSLCGELLKADRPVGHDCAIWGETDFDDEDWDDADVSD
jgi:hypothetical protein